jgi:DNA ligase (NAD+)
MDKEQAQKRIEKLRKLINVHRYDYHVLDKQVISDAAFDSLKHELYVLEQRYPELITPDSPTQRVGGEPLKVFKKVEHEVPMLSIEDIFTEQELADWESYLKRLTRQINLEYYAELKIDGFAVTLVYEKGILIKGATRGNGKIGEDVTQNLKTIESIPLKIGIRHSGLDLKHLESRLKEKISRETLEIRGEVYMDKVDFEKFNQLRAKKGLSLFSNPRNLAAGSIRQLDPNLASSRPLKFLAYDMITDIGQSLHSEEHEILEALGFKINKGKVCKNISDIMDFWWQINKKRDILPHQIDGVVISVNNNKIFQSLGVAGKSPRAVRAFKFAAKQTTTRILDVKVQVGRTGAITPIAVLEPVRVAGVTITRATLHNEDELKRLGAKIGDTVIVERAGDVIPAVVKVLPELRTKKEKNFIFPSKCPVCGAKLSKPENEAIWRCLNQECPARKRENIYHFVSKKSFDIKGLGPKIIDQLMDENLISQAPEIFELKEGDLFPLERFAEKKSKNIIGAIEKSKDISLDRFIYSLGIRHVGEETANDLAKYFGSIAKLKKISKEDLEKIPGIGEKVSESIYEWFQLQKNQKFIDDLTSLGVRIAHQKSYSENQKLKGKNFVLTGSLDAMSRDQAKEKIRLFGGEIADSVSKNTDYLITGKEPGSKLARAKELGVKTVSEKEFLEMIK